MTESSSGEETFDCRACGACCRDASDGRVSVSAEDIVRWKRTGRSDIADALIEGHFSSQAFPARADGSCVHLGTSHNENDCSIYEIRGHYCHLLEPGSDQCRAYRRTDPVFQARLAAGRVARAKGER
jgi:Fe-S-cluster containining protein